MDSLDMRGAITATASTAGTPSAQRCEQIVRVACSQKSGTIRDAVMLFRERDEVLRIVARIEKQTLH